MRAEVTIEEKTPDGFRILLCSSRRHRQGHSRDLPLHAPTRCWRTWRSAHTGSCGQAGTSTMQTKPRLRCAANGLAGRLEQRRRALFDQLRCSELIEVDDKQAASIYLGHLTLLAVAGEYRHEARRIQARFEAGGKSTRRRRADSRRALRTGRSRCGGPARIRQCHFHRAGIDGVHHALRGVCLPPPATASGRRKSTGCFLVPSLDRRADSTSPAGITPEGSRKINDVFSAEPDADGSACHYRDARAVNASVMFAAHHFVAILKGYD